MIEDKKLLEDAIKHFTSLQKRYTREHNGKMCTKVAVALEAIEKQISKKVRYQNRHGEGFDLLHEDYYHCPSCGRRLRNKQHDPYCGRCGQALDWEVVNDE